VDAAGRWIADHSDQYVSVLTIVNATHRDAGLFVCYDVTSARHLVAVGGSGYEN